MAIIRVKKDEPGYVQIRNEPLNDSRLSFGARGILAYLLSKPDDWEVRSRDLYNQSPAGRKAVDRMLNELKDNGYLHRHKVRDDKGQLFWESVVYESPASNPQFQTDTPERPKGNSRAMPERPKSRSREKPQSGKAAVGKGGNIQTPDSDKELNQQKTNLENSMHAAAVNFLFFIDSRKRDKLLELEITTPEFCTAWNEWYEAGNFPKWMDNPPGWAVKQIESGDLPPKPTIEKVETFPAPGPPPMNGMQWNGRAWT